MFFKCLKINAITNLQMNSWNITCLFNRNINTCHFLHLVPSQVLNTVMRHLTMERCSGKCATKAILLWEYHRIYVHKLRLPHHYTIQSPGTKLCISPSLTKMSLWYVTVLGKSKSSTFNGFK